MDLCQMCTKVSVPTFKGHCAQNTSRLYINCVCMCVYILTFSFCSYIKQLLNQSISVFHYFSFHFIGIHRLKQSMPKRKAGKMAKAYDPIAPVAEEISEEASLLCFDEFQVNNQIC